MWIGHYLVELWNAWLWSAGLMLTVFELIQFFWKKTWGWPARHPWIVALVLLVVGQAGAYRAAYSDSNGKLEAERVTVTALAEERDQLRLEKAKLEGSLDEREKQVRRQQEVENELRDRLADAREARPIRIDSPNFPQTPEPRVEGVTTAFRQIPSSRSDAPFALEVTIQARSEVKPFGIGFVCDKPILGGELTKIVDGSILKAIRGEGPLAIDTPDRSWGILLENAISPSNPWVVTLFGKEPFRVIDVHRINKVDEPPGQ